MALFQTQCLSEGADWRDHNRCWRRIRDRPETVSAKILIVNRFGVPKTRGLYSIHAEMSKVWATYSA